MNRKHTLSTALLIFILSTVMSGCYYAMLAGGTTERTVACNCPPDAALRYAVAAAQDLGFDPTMVGSTGFNVMRQDVAGLAVSQQLNVSVLDDGQSKSVVRVRVKASKDSEALADNFVTVFKNRTEGIKEGE